MRLSEVSICQNEMPHIVHNLDVVNKVNSDVNVSKVQSGESSSKLDKNKSGEIETESRSGDMNTVESQSGGHIHKPEIQSGDGILGSDDQFTETETEIQKTESKLDFDNNCSAEQAILDFTGKGKDLLRIETETDFREIDVETSCDINQSNLANNPMNSHDPPNVNLPNVQSPNSNASKAKPKLVCKTKPISEYKNQ